jgi:hypothetical protein
MAGKDFGVVSTKDLHGIRVVFIIILLWTAVWNLTENIVTWFEIKYNIRRWKLYVAILLVALLFIILDPYTFEKL